MAKSKFNFPDFFRRARPGEERRSEVVDRLGGKLSKQDTNYRPGVRDDKASCAECEHYLLPGNPTSNCRKVAGVVYSVDMCDVWVARAAENTVQPPTQNRS